MKRKINEHIFSIIIIVFFLINLSGCTVFVEQEKNSKGESVSELHGGFYVKHGRNPDIESEFEQYEQNDSFVKDSVGYSDNIVYQKCEQGYKIEGHGVLWGDLTICEIELKSSDTIFLTGEVHVEKGNYKLLNINQEETVEVLAEDEDIFNKEIVLEEGRNKIKIVGKPVTFESLNLVIDSNGLTEENMILSDQISFTDENITEARTEIGEIVEKENLLSLPSNEKEDQLSDTNKNTKIEQGTELDKQYKIEEGKFSSLSYLKMGNTLLSGTGIKLNGKKILVELDLSEEKELELEIHYKMKSGKCSLVLVDGDGAESVIEDDITEGKKTITLNNGKNILILDGREVSFLSIEIESNVEEL